GLAQRRQLADLDVAIQVQPRVFQPANISVTLRGANGQPPSSVRAVDLQFAMEGMNHGARGILTAPTGPGAYQAQAMLLAMQGPWWLALRIERGDNRIDSTVFRFEAPRDNSTGAVAAMYDRPTDPVQIVDVAVYPGEISPPDVAVRAGHPVH